MSCNQILASLALAAALPASAAITFYNSPDVASNAATQAAWQAGAGVGAPQYTENFEAGFVAGQNLHNTAFAGGLVMRDTSAAATLGVRSGAGVINGSNTVGSFTVTQNEQPFFELDFSAAPIDYFAALDIDQAGSLVRVILTDATIEDFNLDTTLASGNVAEFFGLHAAGGARIARILIDASGDGLWGLDNLQYGRVPEPGTLALAGLSLLALGLSRRRRA